MRLPVLLLALAALAGCRLESRAPALPDAADASGVAPSARDAPPPPPGTQPASPPDALVNTTTPDGKPAVVLYVTEWCPYCAQAREYMAAEDVPHRIVDIEKDPEGARAYQALGGDGGIPLVAVGTEVMKGWSADMAAQMLAQAGYE